MPRSLKSVSILSLGDGADADGFPVIRNHLYGIAPGTEDRRVFDGNGQRSRRPGRQPEAFRISFGQANAVQQFIGRVSVIQVRRSSGWRVLP